MESLAKYKNPERLSHPSLHLSIKVTHYHRLASLHYDDTMASTDYKFEGWLGHNPESVKGNMKWGEFEPKKWDVRLPSLSHRCLTITYM